jgi:hypothetical protein
MINGKWRKVLLWFMILFALLFSCAASIAFSYDGLRASKQLCFNLLDAEYVDEIEECAISDFPPDFIGSQFPINTVDEIYVRTAMEGFQLSEHAPQDCLMTLENSCSRLVYRIRHVPGNPFLYEYYSFRFWDGKLRSLQWHN